MNTEREALNKDIAFLREMKERLQTCREDITQYQMLETMIDDWLHELVNKPAPPSTAALQKRIEELEAELEVWHHHPLNPDVVCAYCEGTGEVHSTDGFVGDCPQCSNALKAGDVQAPKEGMPSDTEMMFNQMQFGADMVTKYSNACKEVKRLSDLHMAVRESIVRIIDGNYVVPQEVHGEIYCIKNITGEALAAPTDTQGK